MSKDNEMGTPASYIQLHERTDRLFDRVVELSEHVTQCMLKIDDRLRALEEKKDSLRLDWLEQKCSGASDSERYIPFRIYWGGGSHGDIRRAIDEAMEGDQK